MSRWLFLAVFTLSVTVGSWCFLTTSVPESAANKKSSGFALNWSIPDPNVVRDLSEDVRAGNFERCLRRFAGGVC